MDKRDREQGLYQVWAKCKKCGDNRYLFKRYVDRTVCPCGGKYKWKEPGSIARENKTTQNEVHHG